MEYTEKRETRQLLLISLQTKLVSLTITLPLQYPVFKINKRSIDRCYDGGKNICKFKIYVMNSWQTFLASIRLSLPEISSFQRNINFYLKYPDIRSSHAPRHNRPIASPRATCAAHCTVATFFLSFFCYRAARVYGEGKKCGSRRRLGHS